MNIRVLVGFLLFAALVGTAAAASDRRVDFKLKTTDAGGAAVTEDRTYFVYRPDNLPRTAPVAMVLVMAASPNAAPAGFFHRMADKGGFVVVSCNFDGNSSGSSWNNSDPRVTGYEDMDYTSEVIRRVATEENGNDAFICGLSKGGHMAYAYACERPETIRAACSVDEFMGLATNRPSAPVPIIAFHGTRDANVPYTMARDSVDAWRAMDDLLGAPAVTTFESAPRQPGTVTQATWRGGRNGSEVAFVTIVGGDHRYATPDVQTGYDCTQGMWTFFSRFLTATSPVVRIVSQPVNNVQAAGQFASFWVVVTGAAPLRYQWQKNGVDIPGANSNWLTVAATGPDDIAAGYRAIVSNGAGSVASAVATLSVVPVRPGPVIAASPADRGVVAGQAAVFSVRATGPGPLHYQWLKNGMPIPGATAALLTLAPAVAFDSGAIISVTVSDAGGSLTSASATLNVIPAAGGPVIVSHPERSRTRVGQTGTFSVAARSASPVTYQWQSGAFLGQMADIPGATASTYTTANAALADNHVLYRCVVSNSAGSTVSASEMLFVTAP